jgi:rhamnosyltransferase
VVVVDSSSTDGSDAVATAEGFELHRIDVRTFNHGKTRDAAFRTFCIDEPYVIFATQDAVIENAQSLVELLSAFADPAVGAAYGRQLPHVGAEAFESHAALFNYPPCSETRMLADAARLGIKTAFFSNSFAAYRVSALQQCGGFPGHLILGEDAFVAMRMLLLGWSVRYVAEARVRHSHAYTVWQETQRYFDFGVMHAQIPELLRSFGPPEAEGARFVVSEMRFVARHSPWRLPEVPVRNAAKYLGYRLGRGFRHLPRSLRRSMSMTKMYWQHPQTDEGYTA